MSYEQIFRELTVKAEENIGRGDGDYIGEDGLLMCGKCRTRKQTRMMAFGVEITPMCMCRCMVEQEKEQERRRRTDALRDLAFCGDRGREMTFGKDDGSNAAVTRVCRNYTENFDTMRKGGSGLLLYGPVGTGKTFAACCIANELIDRGYRCLVTSITRMADEMFPLEDKQDYLDGLKQFSLLVIDDIGVERSSDYMRETVYKILNARYESGLPMILTTNLSIEDFKHPKTVDEARVFDRILETCFPVEVSGCNRRHRNIRMGYDEMSSLLGVRDG